MAVRDFQLISQDLALSEERNLRLESKLRVATEQRIAAETLSAEASDQIAELTNELNDRDSRLRYYEEQESQLSKEIEARLKLNAVSRIKQRSHHYLSSPLSIRRTLWPLTKLYD